MVNSTDLKRRSTPESVLAGARPAHASAVMKKVVGPLELLIGSDVMTLFRPMPIDLNASVRGRSPSLGVRGL